MTLVALVPCLMHDFQSAVVLETGALAGGGGAVVGAAAAAAAYDGFFALIGCAGGRVGERGGLGGGVVGLVSRSAGCTAAGGVGAGGAGAEPERRPGEAPAAGRSNNDDIRMNRSRRRPMHSLSSPRNSSKGRTASMETSIWVLGVAGGDGTAAAGAACC